MIVKLRNYLMCELPDGWTAEENSGVTSIYRADGDGALTLSYHSIAEMQGTLDAHISIMAKRFLDENQVKLKHALILDGTQKGKTVLYGTGTLPDSWFIKLCSVRTGHVGWGTEWLQLRIQGGLDCRVPHV